MPLTRYKQDLEALYRKYNRRRFVSPDPLEVLYEYDDPADREVVGLIAALLAYGRVKQILISVRRVLDVLGPRPARSLYDAPPSAWLDRVGSFRHRFQTEVELAALLAGMARALRRHGSLAASFAACRDRTCLCESLGRWRDLLDPSDVCGHLIPDARRGGACKRLHLYLRWMVRRDRVDPGAWSQPRRQELIVPLDTHMHRVGSRLGVLSRKSCNGLAAQELTRAFAGICPADPVRYDFALTRWGIREEMDLSDLLGRMILRGKNHGPTGNQSA